MHMNAVSNFKNMRHVMADENDGHAAPFHVQNQLKHPEIINFFGLFFALTLGCLTLLDDLLFMTSDEHDHLSEPIAMDGGSDESRTRGLWLDRPAL